MHNLVIKNTKNLVILYVSYCKLPYIGNLSTENKQKLSNIAICIVKIIVFSTFKIGLFGLFKIDLFSVKELVPKYPRSFTVYRFTCPDSNASQVTYAGKQNNSPLNKERRIKEHLETDSKSHIFKPLNFNRNCKLCDSEDSWNPPIIKGRGGGGGGLSKK